jgi:hypothetical protein
MRSWRIPSPDVVLAVLMVLVGHDVLMAADPHGSVPSPEAHAIAHETSEATCHLPEVVRPDPPDRPEPAVPCMIGDAMLTQLRVDAGRVSWADPPGAPPDVRRALLQVFLN